MCPACFATAAWSTASVISTGGVTALVLKKVVTSKADHNFPTITPTKEDHHG
ncbi:MAG: hypothetical protein ABSE51_20990 [Terracidiphilus sp.]|jgi:hypothetical protein